MGILFDPSVRTDYPIASPPFPLFVYAIQLKDAPVRSEKRRQEKEGNRLDNIGSRFGKKTAQIMAAPD